MTRVTSKGQVTIPKEVRIKLGIGPGTEVGFHERGGQMILRNEDAAVGETDSSGETPGQRLVRRLSEFGAKMRREGKLLDDGQSVDDYMELIRGYSDDANDPGFQRRP
jgi:AbrB family looped-hinge helix DNA binding protein